MIVLITEQNSKISIKEGNIIIKTEEIERKIPKDLVESISIFGNIQTTTAFTSHCLRNDIPISYYSMTGEYFGRTISTKGDNISRLKNQLAITENKEFVLEFTKIITEAKINNQITLLRRYKKYNLFVEQEILQINKIKPKIENTKTKEEILGFEGIASRNYYQGISKILPEEFRFYKRTRMPPLDPFNSMISLGYTILFHEIIGHIESVGLTAYGGIIHGHRRNHPSLASDLIEELRAPIVDSLVISMMQNKKTLIDDFDITENGVFLKKAFLKKYLKELQIKLQTANKYLSYIGNSISYRKGIYYQCRQLVKAIENKDATLYQPLRLR